MLFGQFNSQKAFLSADLTPEFLRDLSADPTDWFSQKLILRHKNCPVEIVDKFSKSKHWYKRIVAMLQRDRWTQWIEIAMQDPKSTVRFCAYKRALFENYQVDRVLQLIKADERLGGYRSMLLGEE